MIRAGQRLSYYKTIEVKIPVVVPEPEENITKTDSVQDTATASKETKEPGVDTNDYIYHDVVKGDTLWNIAQRYDGVTVEQIMEINKITNINSIKPGTRIKVKKNG